MNASKRLTKRFSIVSVLILALAAALALPMLAWAAEVEEADAMGGDPDDVLVGAAGTEDAEGILETEAVEGVLETEGAEDALETSQDYSAKSVALDAISDTLRVGASRVLTVTVSPEDADKNVIWSMRSDDADVIGLYADPDLSEPIELGQVIDPEPVYVKALKPGDATVTVTCESNPEATASCSIMVLPVSAPHKVTVTVEGDGEAMPSSSEAESGDKVTLTSEPGSLCLLKEWQVVSGGVTISDDSFTMGDQDVEIKAVFVKCNVKGTTVAYEIKQILRSDWSGWDFKMVSKEATPEELGAIVEGVLTNIQLNFGKMEFGHGTFKDADVSRTDLASSLSAAQQKSAKLAYARNVTVSMQVEGFDAHNITDTGEPVTFEMDIPEEYQNTDPEVSRTFYMLREHDGELAVVGQSEPNATKVTGSSNLFSLFMVVYVDTPTGTQGTSAQDTGAQGTSTQGASAQDTGAQGTSTPSKLANTGDPLPAVPLAALAFIAAAAVVGARRFGLR